MTGTGISGAWHVDADSLRRWVDGLAGPLASVSVEQHLQRCAQCRAEVAGLVPAAPLRMVWESVLAEVEVRRAGVVERFLVRLGLPPSDALVIASAVTLRAAWLAGVIGVLFFAVLAAIFGNGGGVNLFLVVAPLIPVAGVAAAYGPASDPSYEAVLASPYNMFRLVLLRTASVLVTSVPFAVVAGLLLPTPTIVAVAWLLPAVGFIAVVLTASNWVDPDVAAAVVGIGWISAVGLAVRSGDPLLVFAPAALLTYLGIVAVAGLILLHSLLRAAPSWRLR